jgi:UDP-2-acetamido-2-deoxy-ribo-hexuluronate aminotransferase
MASMIQKSADLTFRIAWVNNTLIFIHMEFIDLKAQYARLKHSLRTRIEAVLERGAYIMGPEVAELEERLRGLAASRHCIACASGTDALLLSLMAHSVGPGDAVFTTPFTFIATAEAIALLGATPVFVDVDPRTLNLDPAAFAAAADALARGARPSPGSPVGLKARGVIAVDIFGVPADYDALEAVAGKRGLFVIEDAAQSFGASYRGRMSGALGQVSAASFYPSKPLGCYGDGGAVFTGDDTLALRVKSLRSHGQGETPREHVRVGLNGRMDTLQAAVLLAKLEIFKEELEAREVAARRYHALLAGKVEIPSIPDGIRSSWAQYSVRSDAREEIIGRLKTSGVPTAIHYAVPLHLQPVFKSLGYERGSFPVAERACSRIFSLPMHAYLTESLQEDVARAIG